MATLHTIDDLGSLIRDARKRQGLRQDELAGAANVGIRFIVELENGKPTAQIGKAFNVVKSLGLVMKLEDPSDELGTSDESHSVGLMAGPGRGRSYARR